MIFLVPSYIFIILSPALNTCTKFRIFQAFEINVKDSDTYIPTGELVALTLPSTAGKDTTTNPPAHTHEFYELAQNK